MQMPIFVRTRNGGKSYALRVKHARLPEPAYLTFDSEAEARRTGELAEAALNRGEMPEWLQGTKENPLRHDRGSRSRLYAQRQGGRQHLGRSGNDPQGRGGLLDCPRQLSLGRSLDLPHGYSGYDSESVDVLREQGIDTPEDIERNRRIDPDEEQRILDHLEARLAKMDTLEERADVEGLILTFKLGVGTAAGFRVWGPPDFASWDPLEQGPGGAVGDDS
jgi:hypothetical protein